MYVCVYRCRYLCVVNTYIYIYIQICIHIYIDMCKYVVLESFLDRHAQYICSDDSHKVWILFCGCRYVCSIGVLGLPRVVV